MRTGTVTVEIDVGFVKRPQFVRAFHPLFDGNPSVKDVIFRFGWEESVSNVGFSEKKASFDFLTHVIISYLYRWISNQRLIF